ncbi:MAG: hypothetical protein WAK90_03080 [Pseudolabrys sp.]
MVEDVIGGALVCAFEDMVGFEVFAADGSCGPAGRNVPTPAGVPKAALILLDRGTLSSRKLEMSEFKHSRIDYCRMGSVMSALPQSGHADAASQCPL